MRDTNLFWDSRQHFFGADAALSQFWQRPVMQTPKRVSREIAFKWFSDLLKSRGISISQVARDTGESESNLYKFWRDNARGMSMDVASRIARHYLHPLPSGLLGFGDNDAVPYDDADAPTDGLWRFQIVSDALSNADFAEGDIAVIDPKLTPEAGDLVLAQVIDETRATAETVIRWYEPPFLIAASSTRAARRPIMIDPRKVIIRGVVTEQIRHKILRKN